MSQHVIKTTDIKPGHKSDRSSLTTMTKIIGKSNRVLFLRVMILGLSYRLSYQDVVVVSPL